MGWGGSSGQPWVFTSGAPCGTSRSSSAARQDKQATPQQGGSAAGSRPRFEEPSSMGRASN